MLPGEVLAPGSRLLMGKSSLLGGFKVQKALPHLCSAEVFVHHQPLRNYGTGKQWMGVPYYIEDVINWALLIQWGLVINLGNINCPLRAIHVQSGDCF